MGGTSTGTRSNGDRRAITRRSEIQLSTTISKEEAEQWQVLCQIQQMTSYALLRWAVKSMLDSNKDVITKKKAEMEIES